MTFIFEVGNCHFCFQNKINKKIVIERKDKKSLLIEIYNFISKPFITERTYNVNVLFEPNLSDVESINKWYNDTGQID